MGIGAFPKDALGCQVPPPRPGGLLLAGAGADAEHKAEISRQIDRLEFAACLIDQHGDGAAFVALERSDLNLPPLKPREWTVDLHAILGVVRQGALAEDAAGLLDHRGDRA